MSPRSKRPKTSNYSRKDFVDLFTGEYELRPNDLPHQEEFHAGCIGWLLTIDIDTSGTLIFTEIEILQTDVIATASGKISLVDYDDNKLRSAEYRNTESFDYTFNDEKVKYLFEKKFPVPAVKSSLLKNGKFKFRLEMKVCNIRKSFFSRY